MSKYEKTISFHDENRVQMLRHTTINPQMKQRRMKRRVRPPSQQPPKNTNNVFQLDKNDSFPITFEGINVGTKLKNNQSQVTFTPMNQASPQVLGFVKSKQPPPNDAFAFPTPSHAPAPAPLSASAPVSAPTPAPAPEPATPPDDTLKKQADLLQTQFQKLTLDHNELSKKVREMNTLLMTLREENGQIQNKLENKDDVHQKISELETKMQNLNVEVFNKKLGDMNTSEHDNLPIIKTQLISAVAKNPAHTYTSNFKLTSNMIWIHGNERVVLVYPVFEDENKKLWVHTRRLLNNGRMIEALVEWVDSQTGQPNFEHFEFAK